MAQSDDAYFLEYVALLQECSLLRLSGAPSPPPGVKDRVSALHTELAGELARRHVHSRLTDTQVKRFPPRFAPTLDAGAGDDPLRFLVEDPVFACWVVGALGLIHASLVFEDVTEEKHTKYVHPYLVLEKTSRTATRRPPFDLGTNNARDAYAWTLDRVSRLLDRADQQEDQLLGLVLGLRGRKQELGISIYEQTVDQQCLNVRAVLQCTGGQAAQLSDLQLVRCFDELIMALGVPGDWHVGKRTGHDEGRLGYVGEGEIFWYLAASASAEGRGDLKSAFGALFPGKDVLVEEYCHDHNKANPFDMGATIPKLAAIGDFNPPVEALFGLLKSYLGPGRAFANLVFCIDSSRRSIVRNAWYVATVEVPSDGSALQARRWKHVLLASALGRIALQDWMARPLLTGPTAGAAAIRPTVYVLDDYNNIIVRDTRGRYSPLEGDLDAWAHHYGVGASELGARLTAYCSSLNDLANAFDVRPLQLWPAVDPHMDSIARLLPLEEIDSRRQRTAAFVVEAEWSPRAGTSGSGASPGVTSAETRDLGYEVIRFLARRYPEIVTVAMHGVDDGRRLQKALASGASWLLLKGVHDDDPLPEELCSEALSTAIQEATRLRHGSFLSCPYPSQLQLDVASQCGRDLVARLRLCLPLGRSERGRMLQGLVAGLFPDGGQVVPTKLLKSGKSSAQATFLAAQNRERRRTATRFIKVGPWFDIVKEARAFEQVVRPRLGSFVPTILGQPIRASHEMGAIAYSTVGLPESHESLKSLDDAVRSVCSEGTGAAELAHRLGQTLRSVVGPFHRGGGAPIRARRPLWVWLGHMMPAAYTGRIVARGSVRPKALTSRLEDGYKEDSAWILAACDVRALEQAATDHTVLELRNFPLQDVKWAGPSDPVEATLRHPDLGFRIRLLADRRGARDEHHNVDLDLERNWVRPGMPATLSVKLDEKNRDWNSLEQGVRKSFQLLGETPEQAQKRMDDSISQRLLSHLAEYCSWTIEARVGPVHGDLNLHNIQLPADQPGWLIDFESATASGMVAFDCAKIEVELCNWYVFPLITQILRVWQSTDGTPRAKLMSDLVVASREVLTLGTDVRENYSAVVGSKLSKGVPPLGVLAEVLSIVAEVRKYARDELQLGGHELDWALGAYFLTSCKFLGAASMEAAMAFAAAEWHLKRVVPRELQLDERFDEAIEGASETLAGAREGGRPLDSAVFTLAMFPEKLRKTGGAAVEPRVNGLLEKAAQHGSGPRWTSKDPAERWDLASTGCVGNITPIVGYLWLMAHAQESQGRMIVPKISSSGNSCGTIDILHAGGLRFPRDAEMIRRDCLERRGVLCSQGPELTPVDCTVMSVRRRTNTIKRAALVYMSILEKKLAMGCTHGIIDVKCGRDTKMLLAPDVEPGRLLYPQSDGVLAGKALGDLARCLKELGVEIETPANLPFARSLTKPSGMAEVRWFCTSADTPQCRAIGRQLILIQLDKMLREDDLMSIPAYASLYGHLLCRVCAPEPDGATRVDKRWQKVKEQWASLSESLPLLSQGDFAGHEVLFGTDRDRYLSAERFRVSMEIQRQDDLRVMTLGLEPFVRTKGELEVKGIDAYELDKLFEWLCGEDPQDPEVGIWLHKLPGEKLEQAANAAPVVSVFFRPSRTTAETVDRRVGEILARHVRVSPMS